MTNIPNSIIPANFDEVVVDLQGKFRRYVKTITGLASVSHGHHHHATGSARQKAPRREPGLPRRATRWAAHRISPRLPMDPAPHGDNPGRFPQTRPPRPSASPIAGTAAGARAPSALTAIPLSRQRAGLQGAIFALSEIRPGLE